MLRAGASVVVLLRLRSHTLQHRLRVHNRARKAPRGQLARGCRRERHPVGPLSGLGDRGAVVGARQRHFVAHDDGAGGDAADGHLRRGEAHAGAIKLHHNLIGEVGLEAHSVCVDLGHRRLEEDGAGDGSLAQLSADLSCPNCAGDVSAIGRLHFAVAQDEVRPAFAVELACVAVVDAVRDHGPLEVVAHAVFVVRLGHVLGGAVLRHLLLTRPSAARDLVDNAVAEDHVSFRDVAGAAVGGAVVDDGVLQLGAVIRGAVLRRVELLAAHRRNLRSGHDAVAVRTFDEAPRALQFTASEDRLGGGHVAGAAVVDAVVDDGVLQGTAQIVCTARLGSRRLGRLSGCLSVELLFEAVLRDLGGAQHVLAPELGYDAVAEDGVRAGGVAGAAVGRAVVDDGVLQLRAAPAVLRIALLRGAGGEKRRQREDGGRGGRHGGGV